MRAAVLCGVILGFGGILGASVSIDLTATGGATLSGGTANGAILDATSTPTTVGTGVIDSFVRIQNSPSEQGYNTDANSVDDNKNGIFTHSLLLSQLDATTKPGYYTFLLDINEASSTALLSLDDIQFYTASVGNLSQSGTPGPGATLKFNLQTATSAVCTGSGVCNNASANPKNEILLNYNNNSGSGNGFDMFLYIPTSVFTGVSPTAYVYLYSAFGGLGVVGGKDYTSDSGFEEWARITAGGQQVPEPVTSGLIGTGLVSLFLLGRRARKA